MTYGFGNEVCVSIVCGVPVASVKDSYGIVAEVGERLEESDETVFVVDL